MSLGRRTEEFELSQFVHSLTPDCFTYVENGYSAANPKQGNKVVPVYAVSESCPHCLVYLLDKYCEKLPPKAFEIDIFTCGQ